MARVKPGEPLPEGLYWRGKTIWVRCISGGVDKRLSTHGQSIQEGEALLARLRSERNTGKLDKALGRKARTPQLADIIDRYLPEWRDKSGWADVQRYAAEWKDRLGDIRLEDLRAKDILAALQDRTAAPKKPGGPVKPLGPAALNRRRQFLETVLNRYIKRDEHWDGNNPAKKVPKLEEIPRVRFAEPEKELVALWKACNPVHLAVFTLAITTGLRRGSILGVALEHVDLDGRVIHTTRQARKKRTPWQVALNDDALVAVKFLAANAEKLGSPWLVPGLDPSQPMKLRSLTQALQRAAARAEIKNLRLHDLRHSWASYLYQAGVEGQALQEAGGWSSPVMVQRYAHGDLRSRRAAMEKLPSVPTVEAARVGKDGRLISKRRS